MYHTCLPQCQTQLARRKEINPQNTFCFTEARAQRVRPLLRAVWSAIAGLNHRGHVAGSNRRIDLEGASDDEPGLVGHRQRLQRVALEQSVYIHRQRGGRFRRAAEGA